MLLTCTDHVVDVGIVPQATSIAKSNYYRSNKMEDNKNLTLPTALLHCCRIRWPNRYMISLTVNQICWIFSPFLRLFSPLQALSLRTGAHRSRVQGGSVPKIPSLASSTHILSYNEGTHKTSSLFLPLRSPFRAHSPHTDAHGPRCRCM